MSSRAMVADGANFQFGRALAISLIFDDKHCLADETDHWRAVRVHNLRILLNFSLNSYV